MSMSLYYKKIREQLGHELIFVPSVAAVIKNGQGDILFQYPGGEYWSLPAGAIELGETPEEAVVWEETGLKVQVKKQKGVFGGGEYRHIYPNGDEVEYLVVVFECEVISGELKSIDGESLKLKYFSLSEKPPLALPYPDKIFL
ncbi:NUDIX domain-containing protein [Bacillus wiedmannii]|uniref:NUDIX domain-containing protein n=1 Tax=Bacillus wiedmannii TaxID=1890302 RepID=UPI00065BCE05|nr:NUDIX domain-containing protein [Bacillus wiedmannii]KMP76442.1 NUDIX hydrolase [Bacillus cereus]MCQ6546572.1 NUDIX domain-containing protein [Bacillus wiedmannii]MCQ6572272.1 NUDIX domain-containing protein [Bacillus wiedmannii]MCU5578340.1 NUDIX domain-containing protein [Bacillus wiedmannii]WMS79609.1 NUDIX domain-containing protein [Bacillus wiedmannii]